MHRNLAILFALLMLLVPLATALADAPEDAILCGSLAEADCAIKKSNSAVMDEVHAFAMALSVHMDIAAADPSENVSITVDGAGRMALDPALMEAASAFESGAGMDSTAMLALVNELIGGLAGEMSLSVTVTGADESSELTLDILAKDGVAAINMAAFADESDQAMAGWLGIELADIVDSAGLEADEVAAATHDLDEAALAGATTIVRLPDSEVNGQPVAVFQTEMDAGALMQALGLAENEGADAGAIELADSASARVLEYISLADYTTPLVEIDMTAMDEAGAASITMSMRLNVSAFNEPVDVALPEDVFVMPLAMMQQMNQ